MIWFDITSSCLKVIPMGFSHVFVVSIWFKSSFLGSIKAGEIVYRASFVHYSPQFYNFCSHNIVFPPAIGEKVD